MTRWSRLKVLWWPWAGLVGAFAGWSLTHQIGSNSAFDKCHATAALPMLLLGLLGLGVIAGGGYASFSLSRREHESGTRRFIALVCTMMACVFGMALLWQTISSLIIPRCYA